MTGEVTKAAQRPVVDFSKLPAAFFEIINAPAWANAIIYGDKYAEPDPEFISKALALQSIMADTVEEAFANAGIIKLQEWLLDRPGETTGAMEITDLYVAASDFETGNSCFVLVSFVMLDNGEVGKFSTGATNVQATLIGLLRLGTWPIRCQFKRGDSKDKGGRYLIHMLPPD
jgi:hypothetical protein